MSIQFNDTTSYKGLIQLYENEIGVPIGQISDDTDELKKFTAQVNLALDEFMLIAIKASGLWQVDDSNQSDYPILTTNLVSGQRDYPFTTDGSGNLILDIYRVLVKDASGVYQEMKPVDQQTPNNNNSRTTGFVDGRNLTGVPTEYDKTANALFLNLIPNYNAAAGVKMLINREASYFSISDVTKKPGVPGLFHRYFFIKPAYEYARKNGSANLAALQAEVVKYEGNESLGIKGSIEIYYNNRQKDTRRGMRANVERNK